MIGVVRNQGNLILIVPSLNHNDFSIHLACTALCDVMHLYDEEPGVTPTRLFPHKSDDRLSIFFDSDITVTPHETRAEDLKEPLINESLYTGLCERNTEKARGRRSPRFPNHSTADRGLEGLLAGSGKISLWKQTPSLLTKRDQAGPRSASLYGWKLIRRLQKAPLTSRNPLYQTFKLTLLSQFAFPSSRCRPGSHLQTRPPRSARRGKSTHILYSCRYLCKKKKGLEVK